MPDTTLYEELKLEYDRMKTFRRKRTEPRWKEVTQLVSPRYGDFGPETPWEDMRYDGIGTECSQLLGDGMFGNLTPATQNWFRYVFVSSEQTKSKQGGKILEDITEHMVQVFNRSTYYDVGPEHMQIGNSFATATMDIREDKETGRIICANQHPRSLYLKTNARGMVDTVYGTLYLTAEQAAKEWGEESLDDVMKQAIKTGENTEYEFVEVVRPNPDKKDNSPLAAEWPFQEIVFRTGDMNKGIVMKSGAKTLSKPTWRWALRGSDPYGWGPIYDAMPDIRTCNQIVRTMLLTLQQGADPFRYDPEEGRAWTHRPGGRGFYRDPNRKSFTDAPSGQNYAQMKDMLEHIQKRVRNTCKVDNFLMLMQIEAQMTAREVVERKREGLTVVSATVGKVETESLDRIHARFLQIEADAKRLPGFRPGEQIPQELIAGGIKVEYLGPISQLQRQIFIEQGIITAIETSVPVFKLWPQSLDMVKAQLAIQKIWSAHATPAELLRTEKEWTAIQVEKAQAAQAAQEAAVKAQVAGQVDPNVKPAAGSPAEGLVGGAA